MSRKRSTAKHIANLVSILASTWKELAEDLKPFADDLLGVHTIYEEAAKELRSAYSIGGLDIRPIDKANRFVAGNIDETKRLLRLFVESAAMHRTYSIIMARIDAGVNLMRTIDSLISVWYLEESEETG